MPYLSDKICGDVLNDKSGGLTSPGYPNNYPEGLSCLWVIKPQDAKSIQVNFDDNFNIQRLPAYEDYLVTSYPGNIHFHKPTLLFF